MDALIEELNTKLNDWQPAVADQVRRCILEIIEMADQDVLDILRTRKVEQEVLDLLDEPSYSTSKMRSLLTLHQKCVSEAHRRYLCLPLC